MATAYEPYTDYYGTTHEGLSDRPFNNGYDRSGGWYNPPATSSPDSAIPVSSIDQWNAGVGSGSRITGGERYGGSMPGTLNRPTVQTGGIGIGFNNKTYEDLMGSSVSALPKTPQLPNAPNFTYEPYQPGSAPALGSSFIEPDKNKINSLTMMGGGNALKSSITNMINKTLMTSSTLPYAVRRALINKAAGEVGNAYSTAMPNIRRAATNEWQSLYGAPKQRAIESANQNAISVWNSQETGKRQDWSNKNEIAYKNELARYNNDMVKYTEGTKQYDMALANRLALQRIYDTWNLNQRLTGTDSVSNQARWGG